jgi:4-hydroxy-tetrahydrodipicolinate synthase
LSAFFLEVLDRSPLPALLYHIPKVTGVSISDEVLDRLDDHHKLVGIKDSTGEIDELHRLTSRFSNGIYLVGNDRLLTACIEGGGSGSITAAASVAPNLVSAVQRGEGSQSELDTVRALLEDYLLGPSVKAILRRCRLGEFATRPPLVGLEPDLEEPLWTAYCKLVPEEHRPRVVHESL